MLLPHVISFRELTNECRILDLSSYAPNGNRGCMTIRDVKNLLRIISKAKKNGLDLGTEFICKNYHNLSHYDAYSLYQVTDKLNSIFLNESSTINFIRKNGFSCINKTNKIKKQITNYAMGV